MLNPQDLEKAKNVQLGLQQFEQTHLPMKEESNGEFMWVCPTCDTDFPCERMMMFMVLQGLSALSAMVPSGNMGAMLSRFNKK